MFVFPIVKDKCISAEGDSLECGEVKGSYH